MKHPDSMLKMHSLYFSSLNIPLKSYEHIHKTPFSCLTELQVMFYLPEKKKNNGGAVGPQRCHGCVYIFSVFLCIVFAVLHYW